MLYLAYYVAKHNKQKFFIFNTPDVGGCRTDSYLPQEDWTQSSAYRFEGRVQAPFPCSAFQRLFRKILALAEEMLKLIPF